MRPLASVWGFGLIGDEQFPDRRSVDEILAAAVGGRLAARAPFGEVRGRGGVEPRLAVDDRQISRFGLGPLSPFDAAGASDLWLCDGRVFEPQAGAGDLRCFRFIAGNDHPDHDTIAAFRKRFLKEIEALFVRVLMPAKEMGVLQMGTVALDGAKIHANASRHSALSCEYAGKLEAQLKQEVAELLAKARS
jgi:hypothetical protein